MRDDLTEKLDKIAEFSFNEIRQDFDSNQRRLMVLIGTAIMEVYMPVMTEAGTREKRERAVNDIVECLSQSIVSQQNIYKFAKEMSGE